MSNRHTPAAVAPAARWPVLGCADVERVVAWHQGQPVGVARFLAHVDQVAARLPAARHAVNLCEDRYAFLVAFCAILRVGQTNLLPPSRAPQAVAEVMATHAGSYALGEVEQASPPAPYLQLPELQRPPLRYARIEMPMIAAAQVAAINYTSGSTGTPQPNTKRWGDFQASQRGNLAMLREWLGEDAFQVVATVPPQHMYGIETSVLMPLLGPASVHAGRPFFPADVASVLAEVPAPRLLVSTPVHLRALVQSGIDLPPLAAVLSATAPMPPDLAASAERRFAAPLIEVLGSTETCVFASRRPAVQDEWTAYAGVSLRPQPDGTVVEAPQLAAPVMLADIVELCGAGRFRLRGRQSDLLDIAGKRASLADLNHRLLAIAGVEDGVMLQSDVADAMGIRRIAALVVAPTLSEAQVMAALRQVMDPVFLPRPLRCVEALPRNETGKLSRQALLALLARS